MPDENTRFQELIRRVRERDEDAATELVRDYEAAIRRVIRIQLRDNRIRRTLDSMDVCQSVMASFFVRTALGQYDLETPQQLLGLLTRIARNKLAGQVNRLRAMSRDYRRDTSLEERHGEIARAGSEVIEQVSARELVGKIRERLGAEEAALAEMRARGMPWRDIAAELGAGEEALRKKLSRGLDRVMTELGLDEPTNE